MQSSAEQEEVLCTTIDMHIYYYHYYYQHIQMVLFPDLVEDHFSSLVFDSFSLTACLCGWREVRQSLTHVVHFMNIKYSEKFLWRKRLL